MKKVALSLLALAVVGVSAFADAPRWDPKVSTGLKGEATATLGYDPGHQARPRHHQQLPTQG